MVRTLNTPNFSFDHKAYVELAGLVGDTKPTDGVMTGSIFVEVDSGKVFFFDEESGDWTEQFSFQS